MTFHIELDANTGLVSIGGLTGVEQTLGASRDVFLGISPGGGAFDPGSLPFQIGSGAGPFSGTEMTYELSATSFVPSFVSIGGERIEFAPSAGGYGWIGF